MTYSTDFAKSRKIIAKAVAMFKTGDHEAAWQIAKTDPLMVSDAKTVWMNWAASQARKG